MGQAYVYLLGMYLGDGTLSAHPKNVWRLRIFQDSRYVGIIEACKAAMREVSGASTSQMSWGSCQELHSSWKHWICLFPQHGRGRKHERQILLADWQWRLVEEFPRELVRGLIQSDGCRVINPINRRSRERVRHYEYPRYFFTNHSTDIRRIFVHACALIGVECRASNRHVLSVARRRSVEILDSFIGPKR